MKHSKTTNENWFNDLLNIATQQTIEFETLVRAGVSVVSIRGVNGTELHKLSRSFLRATNYSPDITITVLREMPLSLSHDIPFSSNDFGPRGRVMSGVPNGIYATADPVTGDMTVYWEKNRQAIWFQPQTIPEQHWSSPFRQILHWASLNRGNFLFHSALIGNRHGAILIAGGSHSGKSTTTAMAYLAGLKCGGDDYVEIVHQDSGKMTAYPIYRVIKIRHKDRFVDLSKCTELETIDLADRDVHILDGNPCSENLDGWKIKAVATINAKSPTGIRQLNPADFVARAAPSTVIQSIGGEHRILECIINLSKSVPLFEMSRPSNVNQTRTMIEEMIGHA